MSEALDLVVRTGAAAALTADGSYRLSIPTDAERPGATLSATLLHPAVTRDALLALGDVLLSDLRFKARDRADYLKYLLQSGKKVTQAVWDAQRAFLEAQYGEAAKEESPLDPMLTISKDELALEVFSRDESAYARLAFDRTKTFASLQATEGTTFVELSGELLKAIAKTRSYRPAELLLAPNAEAPVRKLRVPYRWLRGLGLVQAASTLTAETFEIAPIDLYNVLFLLRMSRAKKSPRALRYELVPGEKPRIVLEPWDRVIEASSGPYRGTRPQVVRTFGRNRLNTLARLLPHAVKVTVHLAGAGLPAFYVVELPQASFTLALSGWSESGWSGAANVDLLSSEGAGEELAARVEQRLDEGSRTLAQLSAELKADKREIRRAVLRLMEQGSVVNDLAKGTVSKRSLIGRPLELAKIRYGSKAEEQAHRLLKDEGAVRLIRVHDQGAEGTAIDGEIDDQRAHRVYKTSFTIDREGRAAKATCTCPHFRRGGLREGPCEHMIALRLKHSRERAALEEARGTEEGRKLIRAETRTLIRREKGKLTTYHVSLDDRKVILRFGDNLDAMRMERLFFGTADAARQEYFQRLEELAQKRFIDADAP